MYNYDIIHLHTPLVSICARIALIGLPFKVVYTVHGFYFHENMGLLNRYIHKFVEWLLAKKTDLILFVSREDYNYAKKTKYKAIDRLCHVGNGCDLSKFRPVTSIQKDFLRQLHGIANDKIVIGYSGRLVKEKGIENLLVAFTRCLKYNKDIILLLCGGLLKNEHGANAEEIIDIFCTNYPQHIVKLGFVDDIQKYYCMMDIFVLPSFREGLPTSLIEACACGIAPIATNIRGCREILTHEVSGLLVDPYSSDDLTQQLNKLISSSSYRSKLAKNALNNTALNYNIDTVLANTIDKIKSI